MSVERGVDRGQGREREVYRGWWYQCRREYCTCSLSLLVSQRAAHGIGFDGVGVGRIRNLAFGATPATARSAFSCTFPPRARGTSHVRAQNAASSRPRTAGLAWMDMLHSLSRRAVLSLTAAACVTLQKPAPARAAIPGIVEYCIPGVTAERCRGTFWETGKLYKKAEGVAMTQAEYSQALTELDSLGTELKRLGQLADDGLAGEVGAGAAKTRVALRQAGERVILALVGDDRLDSNRRLLLVIAVLDDVDREALSQPATSRSNAAAGFAPLRLMLDSASRRFEDFRKALPAQPADVEDI